MIVVTFALPTESADFRRHVRESHVHIVHTGVGQASTQRSTRALFEQHAPTVVISCGFAGALTDALAPGALFLAENFSDNSLAERAKDSLRDLNLHAGNLATVRHITDTAAERQELARKTGADVVDMETQFIAEACAERSVPFLSLRAITDTPSSPLGIPGEVLFDLERQRVNAGRLLGYIAKNPMALFALRRLAQRAKGARQVLALALERLCRERPG